MIWISGSLLAQGDSTGPTGFFVPRHFARYFISDIGSPVTKVQLGIGTNGADYNNDPGRTAKNIVLEEITLGADIPLYSGNFRLAGELLRFSVAGSISSVIWFDFLNTQSSPILDVDYRVGCPEIYIVKDFNSKPIRNVLLRVAFLQHESTHIGDELTLYRKEAGFPITRMNVSYESGEMSLTLNDPASGKDNNHAFTLGGRLLYKNEPSDGYYTMQTWEGDVSGFVSSKRRLEGYVRYQYDGPAGPLRIGRFYPVVSAELRQRVKYGYSYYETDAASETGFRVITAPEKYAPCLNIYAGWHDPGKPGQRGHLGGYFRYYTGINPYGQFRNIPHYSFFGVALVYEQ